MNVRGSRICLAGSTSGLGRALARELAAAGAFLHLAARDRDELERDARDLSVRHGASATWSVFDAEDFDQHPRLLSQAREAMGGMDGLVVAFGMLGDQQRARRDFAYARRILDLNFTAPASLLALAANLLEVQRGGFLMGIGSVAGDRGRQSNYTYGAAKGGLHLYLQGLRNRLAPAGVKVFTIKPGILDTAMIFGSAVKGTFLAAQPETAARGILRALRTDREVVYVPAFWWGIISLIKAIPEPIFKGLKT